MAKPLQIGPFGIGADSPTLVIAEIGLNHNGCLETGKQLVDEAVAAGADCAKFQLRDFKELYCNDGDPNDPTEDLGAQYVLDILKTSYLSTRDMFQLFNYCKQKGIMPLCTPWDMKSVRELTDYGIGAFKVASADLTNHALIKLICATRKPIIVSTGMSTESEIKGTVSVLRRFDTPYILMHCIATYPAPFKDLNLRYLERLREIGRCYVGYSGHERGFNAALAAVALGAKVIEKHFTLDRNMKGNDHKISLLPKEFKRMVEGIRQVESSLGKTKQRVIGPGEKMNREVLAKSLVAKRDIAEGQVIKSEMVHVKSPGKGLQPNRIADLVGKKAPRVFRKGDFFFESDITGKLKSSHRFLFKRPFGIPVRYHDFDCLRRMSNADFVEFHLSYKDLEQDINVFFKDTYELGITVHSPDFFESDHILNLASKDKNYRALSITYLQRVIEVTRALTQYFRGDEKTRIIVSPGGFSRDEFVRSEERWAMYETVASSLNELDTENVEILIQTLPPFPWYMGGQLFCNLFVDPDDAIRFCQQYGYRLCLDLSHSKLAANYYRANFGTYLQKFIPLTSHIHISDAASVDGEGLQIGEGEIDFSEVSTFLARGAPRASFIPEVWQGHKNNGEGFWTALEHLEQWL